MNIEEAVNYLEENLKNWKDTSPNLSNKDIVEEVDKDYRAIETLLTAYEKEKEKNKNKDKILQNIREEFLKYDWKNANPIQAYNQVKSLYESIYCELYED